MPYQDQDVIDISDALKRIASDRDHAARRAWMLREMLSEYTWARCVRQFVGDIGWIVPDALTGPTPAVLELPTPQPVAVAVRREPELLALPTPAWRPGHGYADSLLLRAEEACVPFDPGRAGLVSELLAWAREADGFPLMVRLHTGPGGIGKTRLLLEVCHDLGPDWRSGFLVADCRATDIPVRMTSLLRDHHQVLIVVDYAETRRAEVATLVETALGSPDRRVRIVLLARDAGEWWDRLASDYPRCEHVFAGIATSGPYALRPLHVETADRGAAYFEALEAFAARLGIGDVTAHASARPDLSADHFGSPLYVQMAALLALRGERSDSASGLIDGLLRHEERYWSRLAAVKGVVDAGRITAHLLALSTLSGGIATAREARELYVATNGPNCDNASLQTLFRMLCGLYPGPMALHPLRPDVLGERLVARVLALADEPRGVIVSRLLGPSSSEPARRQALTVLTRLARQSADMRSFLMDALRNHFVPCILAILDVALETGQPLPEIAAGAFEQLSPPQQSQVYGLLRGRIPSPSVKLAELALRLAEFALARARSTNERRRAHDGAQPELAEALISIGVRLRDLGRLEEAFERTREAHGVLTQLINKRLGHYEAGLARTLHNLSLLLNDLGRFEEALERAAEAHVIVAGLATARLDRYEGDLAASLSNLGSCLRDLGRFEEALARATEAHAIYTRLATVRPDRYEPELAASLSNLGGCLSALGRFEEALERAGQAHTIRTQLATARPDRYEAALATSLNNMGNYLSELGRFEEALARASEAHAIRMRLAMARPDRYEAELAASLNNLGTCLSDLGRFEEALARAGEAQAIYARLASTRPDRYEAELAASLSNLGYCLSDLGWFEEALGRAAEAQAIYARLATVRPDRYEASLATALNNLGNRLSNLGRSEEALERAGEAHAIRARLAVARPYRYQADLAASLNNMAGFLSDLGRSEEALARAQESRTIYEQLATARPERYTSDVAMSLSNLSNRLSDLGRFEEAVACAQEARTIYARLTAARPNRYEANVAESLNNLGIRLSDLGRFDEALDGAREAHAIFQRLAKTKPLRYVSDLLSSRVWLPFVAWHVGLDHAEMLDNWPEQMQRAQMPAHKRDLLTAWHAIVKCCYLDRNRAGSGVGPMADFMASFGAMAAHHRRALEPYHLVAMAYLAQHAPNEERTTAYARAWRNFLQTRGSRMPARVTATIKKLNCDPPHE